MNKISNYFVLRYVRCHNKLQMCMSAELTEIKICQTSTHTLVDMIILYQCIVRALLDSIVTVVVASSTRVQV